VRQTQVMDDAEINRLRKAIHRSYGSSPHKKKYWLALLEMQVAKEKGEHSRVRKRSRESMVAGPSVRPLGQ
jgi:hypothetical protein